MDFTVMLVAAALLLAACALVTWAWLAMAQVEEELRAFSEGDDLHLEL